MDRLPGILQGSDNKRLLYYGIGILATGWVATRGWSLHIDNMRRAKRTAIREDRDRKIAKLAKQLSDVHVDGKMASKISALSAAELAGKVISGELTSVEVLRTYQCKALEAHSKTNCLTNVIEDAYSLAQQLDATDIGERHGLLYGVPISIKDNICTKGHLCTLGTVRLAGNYAQSDALLVEVLKAEGAIPFVKTNIPQLVMSYETTNAIYGVTVNPRDITRTPGGSSGGEAALIATGGSPLGLGSDIGGSIRVPAAFSGVCGLKPTSSRITHKGQPSSGQTVIVSSLGPMARDVDSLVVFMRAILGSRMFDNDGITPPVSFNETLYENNKPLKIGFYTDDGYFPACPATARAVMVTKNILERQGHKLVPWTPPNVEKCIQAIFASLSGDKGVIFSPMLSQDNVDPCISFFIDLMTMHPVRRFVNYWLSRLMGNQRLSGLYSSAAGRSGVRQWFDLVVETRTYFQKFEEDWRKHKLDAIICPSHVVPASHLGESDYLLQCGNYGTVFNLLDVPAGIVPVTRVTAADTAAGYEEKGPLGDFVRRTMKGAEGLPVAVQCVTMRWKEELCLRLMKEVERGRIEQLSLD